MNRRPLPALLAMTVAATVLLPVTSTPALAADPATKVARAQAKFSCQLAAKGYEDQPSTEPVVVSYQLEVPTSVTPGQVVPLRGVLSAQFSDELRELTEYFSFESLEGVSSDLGVMLTINGKRTHHVADRWQTGKTPIKDPLVVKAPVTFPAFVVPANASGSIEIAMPDNDAVGNPHRFAPKRAAFSAAATVTGPALTYEYLLACVLPKGSSPVVARIPVRAATAPGSVAAPSSTPTGSGAVVPGTATPKPDPATPGGPATPEATGGAAPAPGSTVTSGTAPLAAPAAAPQVVERDGVRVQAWVLWLLLGLGLVLVAGYAVPVWLRIRRLEDELDL